MSLITRFDPWKNKLCTCPEKYSLSAYTGCGHGCLYCYASSYIPRFFDPRGKKNFLSRLDRELKNIPRGSIIAIANSSDPYTPPEAKMRLTEQALKILSKYPLRINIVTKSTLVLRDLPILKDMYRAAVSLSVAFLDKILSKKIEPYAPGPGQRLKAAEKISACVPLAVRLDPLIYPLNTGAIKQTVKRLKECGAKQIITSTYKIKPDNFQRMAGAFPAHQTLWQNLYSAKGRKKTAKGYLAYSLRKELIESVRAAAEKEKLLFSSCREGFGCFNTAACDGSFLIEVNRNAAESKNAAVP